MSVECLPRFYTPLHIVKLGCKGLFNLKFCSKTQIVGNCLNMVKNGGGNRSLCILRRFFP